MARPVGGTIVNKESIMPVSPDKLNIWQAGNILGMNSTQDPTDISNELGINAEDCTTRFDGLERREGIKIETIVKPNNHKILETHYHKQLDGTINIWRFTRDSVSRKNSVTYSNYIGVLTGTDTDPIHSVSCFDKIVFTNGIDKLKLIDISGLTFADLSILAATKFKYITVFYNRVIAAYDIVGNGPTTVAWSAEYPAISEWDSTVDPSAGRGPIIDSPNDESDFITQILGAEEALYIFRERSIWVGSKQPSASNPFYFRTLIASIGCDCSQSAALIPGGIIWADTKSGTVWKFQNGQLSRLGLPIEKEFIAAVTNVNNVKGCYNQATQEYALLVETLDSTSPVKFLWSGRNDQWTKWNIIKACTVASHPYGTGTKSIDELVGTIDSLTGTIDSLGGVSILLNPYVYGTGDGEILYTTPLAGVDESYNPFNAIVKAGYDLKFESKIFTLPRTDEFITELRIYYDCEGSGQLKIWYRKNDNILSNDENSWTLLKSITASVGWQKFIKFSKNIRCRNYQFRITFNAVNDVTSIVGLGKLRLLRFEIQNYQAGESKK